METSTMPIRFILQGRQFLYYWSLLQKYNTELAKQVFTAQRDFPSTNDWKSIARKELSDFRLSSQIIKSTTLVRINLKFFFCAI